MDTNQLNNNIPITLFTFDRPIYPNDLPRVRGAMIEQVLQQKEVFEEAGLSTNLFHNHDEESWDTQQDMQFVRYPLIHYKIRHKKAELVGIGPGAQALELWLQESGGNIIFGREKKTITVTQLYRQEWQPALAPRATPYRMNKWLPFSKRNYRAWQATDRLTERVQLLEKILWGNVFQLTDSLDIVLPREQTNIYLSTIDMQTFKKCYGIQKMAFDVTFATNINIPDELGLGQGVSVGFGKVQLLTRKPKKPTTGKQLAATPYA